MSPAAEPGAPAERSAVGAPGALPTYVWEPTNDFLAARYGLPRESIVRFDVNTSPLPPDLRDVLAGSFDPPLCEYPPSDYASGANHVLPTGGLARSCGALATDDYGKFIQVQRITREGLATIRAAVESIAEAEGLIAHKRAVEVRFEEAES